MRAAIASSWLVVTPGCTARFIIRNASATTRPAACSAASSSAVSIDGDGRGLDDEAREDVADGREHLLHGGTPVGRSATGPKPGMASRSAAHPVPARMDSSITSKPREVVLRRVEVGMGVDPNDAQSVGSDAGHAAQAAVAVAGENERKGTASACRAHPVRQSSVELDDPRSPQPPSPHWTWCRWSSGRSFLQRALRSPVCSSG